jgi:hypothetical protein
MAGFAHWMASDTDRALDARGGGHRPLGSPAIVQRLHSRPGRPA